MKSKLFFLLLSLFCAACSTAPLTSASQTATVFHFKTLTPARPLIETAVSNATPIAFATTTLLPISVMDDIFRQSTDTSWANMYGEIPQQHYGEVTSNPDCVHSGQYGLRIVNTKLHSWGGYWGIGFAEEPFDTSEFSALSFWIKGTSGNENVTIWVSRGYGADPSSTSNLYVEISPSEWRLASIPLSDFVDPPYSVKSVATIYFTLAAQDEKQSICIDDFAFIR